MDFIEKLFHITLDGGNGSLEVLYLMAIPAISLALLLRRWRQGRKL